MKSSKSSTVLVAVAWITILAITLPQIILQEIFHFPVSENLQYQIAFPVLLAGLVLVFVVKTLRPLRLFFGLFLVLVGAQWLVYTRLDQLPIYQRWLQDPSFNIYMLAEQSLHLVVTLAIIVFLWIVKKNFAAFFLAKGDVSAPVEPVRWLGVKAGERWGKFGWILAICISLGTLAFLIIAGRPPMAFVVKALPFLPAVLLAAALNAFNEELTYKASFLSVLEDAVGRQQALLLVAAFFGLLHFYGVPYGIVGVILAAFLGWILGKSMLETRGLFWAWFIHFLQDVLIFAFLAIGSITPGG